MADGVLRTVVEVAPFVLGPLSRIYRWGLDELALALTDSDTEQAEEATIALRKQIQRVLADRGFPSVSIDLLPMALPSFLSFLDGIAGRATSARAGGKAELAQAG